MTKKNSGKRSVKRAARSKKRSASTRKSHGASAKKVSKFSKSSRAVLVKKFNEISSASGIKLIEATGSVGRGWTDIVRHVYQVSLKEACPILRVFKQNGTLRFEMKGNTQLLANTIFTMEIASSCTCEECGAIGKMYVYRGEYMVRCKAHAPPVETDILHYVSTSPAKFGRVSKPKE